MNVTINDLLVFYYYWSFLLRMEHSMIVHIVNVHVYNYYDSDSFNCCYLVILYCIIVYCIVIVLLYWWLDCRLDWIIVLNHSFFMKKFKKQTKKKRGKNYTVWKYEIFSKSYWYFAMSLFRGVGMGMIIYSNIHQNESHWFSFIFQSFLT
jgi:c-di-AMP phosphodiesterase-like protein